MLYIEFTDNMRYDTPVPVLLPGNKKTKTGRLWTYVCDDRNAGQSWRRRCSSGGCVRRVQGAVPQWTDNGSCLLGSCPPQDPRCARSHPSALTEEALKRIGELYAIEAEIRGMPAKQRLAERQQKAKPRLKFLESWLRERLR